MTFVGKLKETPTETDQAATFIQLADLARELFYASPSRKFVQGFQLCGDRFRAWRFDRSRAIGSSAIPTNKSPKRFLATMVHYARVKPEPAVNCLNVTPAFGLPFEITLEPIPVFVSPVIVGRATTCWRAKAEHRDVAYIVKQHWRLCMKPNEGGLLQQTACVFGVVPYVAHEDVCDKLGTRITTREWVRRISQKHNGEMPGAVDISGRLRTAGKRKAGSCLDRVKHRILSQVIMAADGIPITRFSCPKELLGALIDVMIGESRCPCSCCHSDIFRTSDLGA